MRVMTMVGQIPKKEMIKEIKITDIMNFNIFVSDSDGSLEFF